MSDEPPKSTGPFGGSSEDTREQILQATLETIQAEGFAGLSIQRITDEADVSKSSVYHFFDDKDDLLLSFLDAMLEEFSVPLASMERADPLETLWAHVDFALYGLTSDTIPPVDVPEAGEPSGRPFVDLRSQATHDAEYRARFTEIDDSIRRRIVSLIERGIDDGTFRPVDPEGTAEFLLTLMFGGLFRRATSEDVDPDAIRDELERFVESRLLVDED